MHRLSTAIALLASLALSFATSCNNKPDSPVGDLQNDPKFRYQSGLSALRSGNAERAVRDLEAARGLDPTNVDVLWALGLALSEAGNGSRAVDVLTEALGKKPNDPQLLNSRGVALLRQRRFEEAVKDFEAALAPEAHYDTPDVALLNLADAYSEMQRYSDSIATIERALEHQPRSPALHVSLCRTYDLAKRSSEALAACQEAVADDPTYPAGYFELGKLELRQGHNDQALASFEKCLKLAPKGDLADQARRYFTLLSPGEPPPGGGRPSEPRNPVPEPLQADDPAAGLPPGNYVK